MERVVETAMEMAMAMDMQGEKFGIACWRGSARPNIQSGDASLRLCCSILWTGLDRSQTPSGIVPYPVEPSLGRRWFAISGHACYIIAIT